MTPELIALGLAGFLYALQTGIAGASASRDAGPEWNTGPRDVEPFYSIRTGRLRRAAANHAEGLAFFTIAVVIVILSDSASTFTAVCAWAYLGARLLYIPAYVYAWSPGRSLIWMVGFVSTIAMLIASLF